MKDIKVALSIEIENVQFLQILVSSFIHITFHNHS